MALDLLAKAANETNAVRRAGLEALAESYTHMGEQANGHTIDRAGLPASASVPEPLIADVRFLVRFQGKADMTFCTAHVCL
jgi:hypothetical protein